MSYKKMLETAGFSYLGNHAHSTKVRLSEEAGTVTYCIYMAPADLSGYNVCPNNKFCRQFCLNGSGHAKLDILSGKNRIQSARIKKARLFFEDRELFMRIMVHEIEKCRRFAEKIGYAFAVRINGTSDLSPEDFILDGKNVLEIFPDVQFYDYTKVYSRINLIGKYENYDLTFSYNGHNLRASKIFLEKGGKVAVVFANQKMLPKTFAGFPVWDANSYDMRYLDPAGHVMGLHFHTTAANYDKEGNYIAPNSDFVVADTNPLCGWDEPQILNVKKA